MEEPWDQFTTNTGESNSYVRFCASDTSFSFLMVPEDRGSRFLKHILHQFLKIEAVGSSNIYCIST